MALGVPNTAIPYKILANTKYYIENQQNTYTTLIICHTCLKFHPSSDLANTLSNLCHGEKLLRDLEWLVQRSESMIIVCNNNHIVD